MKRREFITLLGGAAAAWPLAARAQQAAMPVIGFLGIGPASANASRVNGLRSGLTGLGYVEDRNIIIEFRWADGPAQLRELAAELAQRHVAVIVSGGNSAAGAAKAATSSIPIVFSAADDPVRLGYVSSFNRPGGNMTGLSMISGALGAKRLELLRELVPNATMIAVLTNPNNPAEDNLRGEQATARSIGQRITGARRQHRGRNRAGIRNFCPAAGQRAHRQRRRIVHSRTPASRHARRSLPPTCDFRVAGICRAGGLMSYGTSFSYSYHQMGVYVGRILKGEKPADFPSAADQVRIGHQSEDRESARPEVPPTLLAGADEVIE